MTNDRTAESKRRNVVVSNVNCNITAEYLANYLTRELNIDKENIRVTPLRSSGKGFTSAQFRISAPANNYNSLMTPDTWPKNVIVRDYVFKPRNNEASMDNFLEKERSTRTTDAPPQLQQSNNQDVVNTLPVNPDTDVSIADSEMEQTV